MNKKELIEALKDYPDDAEIRLWRWTETGSKYYLTTPTLSNNPTIHPETFDLSIDRLIPEAIAEVGEQVEFKYKRENIDWEYTPVFVTKEFDNLQKIEKYAETMSRVAGTEVRWNYKGCSQGHYVNVNR